MSDKPLLQVGDVFTVDHTSYMRGHGPFEWPDGSEPLTLRVTHYPVPVALGRANWVALVGVALGPEGYADTKWVGVVRTNALPGYRPPPCAFGCVPCPPL
ncbi:hypothetical protein ACI2K4_02010 [Micromonospora sp. NPDC050397]|uniref:hypothetical protein n=1 Tax=Micromonospora sp. NPDC050397 TaxID=3364279 RepID=UPI00384CCD0A